MTQEQFEHILNKLKGRVNTLYFHVKGEPLLHPLFADFLRIASDKGFLLKVTTNGTLLALHKEALAQCEAIRRLNVSLQSLASIIEAEFDANLLAILESVQYIAQKKEDSALDFLASLRIWTQDNTKNTEKCLSFVEKFFCLPKNSLNEQLRFKNGAILKPHIALHTAKTFEWPSLSAQNFGSKGFCRALRDHAGILVDGRVIPCCLDGDGIITLGNILEQDWETIINGERSQSLYTSFTNRKIIEPLCLRCGYRQRFD